MGIRWSLPAAGRRRQPGRDAGRPTLAARPRRGASLGQPYGRSTSRPRGLEAARELGRARRLAGSMRRPTRARPRTQKPSRARVARCELAPMSAWSGADRQCIGRAPGRGRASSPSRRAETRAIAGQQPPRLAGALAKSMLHPPPYATQPASIHRRRCRTGATRARRTAHGASQKVRTHRRHARAHARTGTWGSRSRIGTSPLARSALPQSALLAPPCAGHAAALTAALC